MTENSHLETTAKHRPTSPELKKISKLHFLVHPGFIMEKDLSDFTPHPDNVIDGLILLDNYIKKARSLGSDEVMIILSASTARQMKLHLNKPYLQTIKKIKEILGDRAIVLADRLHFLDEEETQEKVKKLLASRGYFFDEQVLSEAYGETLGCCVDETADGFNRGAGLKNKTVVKIGLTSGKGTKPETMRQISRLDRLEHLTYE